MNFKQLYFYAEDLTNRSYDDILNAEQLQKLLYLLESTEDPVIIEKALVTLGNNAAFSANQVSTLVSCHSQAQALIVTLIRYLTSQSLCSVAVDPRVEQLLTSEKRRLINSKRISHRIPDPYEVAP